MIKIIKKGKVWELFDSINVHTSLDDLCGTFSCDTSLKSGNPLELGDLLELKAESETGVKFNLIKGYIEKTSGTITVDSASVNYSGRDQLGDLVDSSVPPQLGLSEGGISLPALCSKILKGLEINASVINLAGNIKPFSDTEIAAVGFGGLAGEFLQSFARKRQLFLNTDGSGNLVIFSPPQSLGYKRKLTKESMLSRDFSYSDLERFNTIEVGSEDNFSQTAIEDPDNAYDRRSSFKDNQVRKTRYLQIQAEESMDDLELEGKAQEEVNIRRARAFTFQCTVPSHEYEKGKLIKVEDDLSGVYGTLLIRAVDYMSSKEGNISKLTLCFPETYSGVGNRVDERKAKMGIASEALAQESRRFLRGIFAVPGEI